MSKIPIILYYESIFAGWSSEEQLGSIMILGTLLVLIFITCWWKYGR